MAPKSDKMKKVVESKDSNGVDRELIEGDKKKRKLEVPQGASAKDGWNVVKSNLSWTTVVGNKRAWEADDEKAKR